MAICGQLNSRGQPGGKISDERLSGEGIATPDTPGGDKLRICVERYPRPYVAVAEGARVLLGHVLRLGVAERPKLVALNPFELEVPQGHVLVPLAGVAKLDQELEHRALGYSRHAAGSPDADTLTESGHDLDCGFRLAVLNRFMRVVCLSGHE